MSSSEESSNSLFNNCATINDFNVNDDTDTSMIHCEHRWPRILFLDAYDSFTNNIVDLVKESINAEVTVIKIDDERFLDDQEAFESLLSKHDAVIAGPGPGSPRTKRDVGLFSKLWTLDQEILLPVLGICLGFQSLAFAFGASIECLNVPRHGIVGRISHQGSSLFRNAGSVRATQYHSLHANTGHKFRGFNGHAQVREAWLPSAKCPDLKPLAWVFDDVANGVVLMAVEHASKPFWGLQYHPESICTNDEGKRVVQCWWIEAMAWTHKRHRNVKSTSPVSPTTLSKEEKKRPARLEFNIKMSQTSLPQQLSPATELLQKCIISGGSEPVLGRVNWTELPLRNLSVLDIQQKLQLTSKSDETILLESGTRSSDGSPINAETGRFTILACLDADKDERLQYSSTTHELLHINNSEPHSVKIPRQKIWKYLKSFMRQKKTTRGPSTVPFWGGLVGFVSYEACLESINVEPIPTKDEQPSMYFVFVSRSVVIDHIKKRCYVQTIKQDDKAWLNQSTRLLQGHPEDRSDYFSMESFHNQNHYQSSQSLVQRQKRLYNLERKLSFNMTSMDGPTQEEYCDKITDCQDALYSGESYELCLTDQTEIVLDQKTSDSNLYKQVRLSNPAPFGAFLRMNTLKHRVSIIGSSPERFLKWDRNGKCQFRPIKGTVKKGADMTLAKAEEILSSSKERAENLMIVDLIRHDVYGVAGSGNVSVTKLMSVEEYETVYQLVSVIEGDLAPGSPKSGIDVLAASLPPGSMTGAPKRRSCEILKRVEGKPRGIYSGVLGYLDVGGGGDFSVVIRTAYKWERLKKQRSNDTNQAAFTAPDLQKWRIGAGGAVTIQSLREDEWDEMLTKREAILDTFMGR